MEIQIDCTSHAPELAAPERPRLTLGFIPLTDCAPLIMAQELGLFARNGLEVVLSREPSWANIRDKVCCGLLDGGQMLAGMPLAATLGADAFQMPMVTAFSMSLNGNAITVSCDLYQRLLEIDPNLCRVGFPQDAGPLKALLQSQRSLGGRPLRFAMVFPSSTHNYLLRYWLASSGIDPDRDVDLCVVPPPQMVAHLREGLIDGYCVGEPWNALAVEEGVGCTLISSYEIWNNHPEKVLGVTRDWSERHPATHQAMLVSLIQAARWLDEPGNRTQAAAVLSRPEYVNVPSHILLAGLGGTFRFRRDEAPRHFPDFHVFHRYAANFPWISHAEWFVSQMRRWGQIKRPVDARAIASAVYRPDLYRRAAAALNLPCPPTDAKPEGLHDEGWLLATPSDSFDLGPDRFFDGSVFRPGGDLLAISSSGGRGNTAGETSETTIPRHGHH